MWVNGAKAVFPGGKKTNLEAGADTAFRKTEQKRHTAKNVRGRGAEVVYRRRG